MERNEKLKIYCLWAASLILGVFGAVCLFIAIKGEYDNALGYFSADSVFSLAVYCCLAAGAVFGAAGYVFFKKHSAPDRALPGGAFVVIASCVSAALILFSTVYEVMLYAMDGAESVHAVVLASWVLGVLCALSLICTALFAKSGTVKAWISLLSFAPALYCASQVLILYFDQSVAVNSPIKIICQLSYIAVMLVFCTETGLSLGKGKIFARYIFSLCAAVTICGVCALAAAAVLVSGAPCNAFSGMGDVSKVGLFIYVCVRLVSAASVEATIEQKPEKTEIVEE